MSENRYILEPYKGMNTRYFCPAPNCGKGKTFSLYIDTETGEHIHPTVGRCNRESNCGYHYTPKQYFQDNPDFVGNTPQPKTYNGNDHSPRPVPPQRSSPLQKHVSFIPVEVFKASLKAHETNHFVKFLINLFGVEVASQQIGRYFIASSKHWNGATVFWQIDTQGKVRTGKIMLYNPATGKRVKEPFSHINWVHKALKQSHSEQPEFELKQCLFGEHLLIDKTNGNDRRPVAIVESEKTAVIASVYLPQFIWLAAGSLTNLNAEKCSILKGRTVTLFPDLNGFEKWSSKAKELSHLATFTVSNLLERKATKAEKQQGLDLADYLTRFDFREFAVPDSEATKPPPAVYPLAKGCPVEVFKTERIERPKKEQFENWTNWTPIKEPESWEQDITELENYFTGIELPTQPLKLNQGSTVTDCSKFIESHFATVKTNKGKRTFLPYLNRLREIKDLLMAAKQL